MKQLALLATVATAACSPHKVTVEPAAPVAVPASFSKTAPPGPPLPDRWWKDFGDQTLDRMVSDMLAGNLQLRGAWARLRQARAIATAAGSGQYPQLDLSASASRRKIFNQFAANDPTGMTPSSFEIDTFATSLAAGYELDLWKRMSNQAQAAVIDARGARGDVEGIAMSLVAEVAEAWFDLVYQRAQRTLLGEQLELNQSLLDLVELRFQGGLASAVELLQQRQQLIATRSQLVTVDVAEQLLQHRLALLVGRAPTAPIVTDVATALALPELPPLPGAGLPADLLVRRPDVRAARDRVIAADYRVAVAVADRLPQLRIGGSLDFQDTSIADVFTTPLWSILGSLTAPLFDGWRRKAEVTRQRAVVEERLASFGQTFLSAMAEVEGALVSEREQLRLIAELDEQVLVAGQNLTEARNRYEQGIGNAGFLDVLTALQGQQSAQLNLLGARRRLISHRIQLCRALGGTWTQALETPKRLEPTRQKPRATPTKDPS